jgi:invasion protein IalB
MMRQSRLVLVALVLIVVGAGAMFWKSGSSSSDGPNMATFGFQDWLVRCQAVKDKAGCGITQKILDQRSGQPVLQLAMASQAGAYQLAVVVPLGVSVPDGVTMQIGDTTRKIAYTQCLPGGCVAPLAADAALIDKMKSATDARVGVVDRSGKPIAVPFSLKGFGPAFDKMESKGGLAGSGASWWTSLLGN